ncbi:UNVERIFIED_CONTAM: hypothetical protein RMT77_003344 [Armadillidium vulgare]|nr:60S ribosomal protein L13a [Armadillidium vulgare]
MGSFMGHIVPGTFFLIFSLWWTWSVFHKYFICLKESKEFARRGSVSKRKKNPPLYINTLSFPCTCCCARLPLEGVIKIIAVIIGMTGEFVCGFENGRFSHLNNAQHMTMFFFFGLNGVMDILHHYRIPLPPDLEYASGILALGMEALLFFYHLHGRPPMDIQVHMLLFYVIICGAVAAAFEMRYRNNVLPALCRIYFIMLQGTWFYGVAFILYPPVGEKWDVNSHQQMMIVTLIFTWHNAAIFVFLLVSGILIYFRVKSMDRSTMHKSLLSPLSQFYDQHDITKSLDYEQTKNIMMESEEEEV